MNRFGEWTHNFLNNVLSLQIKWESLQKKLLPNKTVEQCKIRMKTMMKLVHNLALEGVDESLLTRWMQLIENPDDIAFGEEMDKKFNLLSNCKGLQNIPRSNWLQLFQLCKVLSGGKEIQVEEKKKLSESRVENYQNADMPDVSDDSDDPDFEPLSDTEMLPPLNATTRSKLRNFVGELGFEIIFALIKYLVEKN